MISAYPRISFRARQRFSASFFRRLHRLKSFPCDETRERRLAIYDPHRFSRLGIGQSARRIPDLSPPRRAATCRSSRRVLTEERPWTSLCEQAERDCKGCRSLDQAQHLGEPLCPALL